MMDPCLYTFIDKLEAEHTFMLPNGSSCLMGTPPGLPHICLKNHDARIQFYGHDVYIRGLIEFTNYCRNNCYYCGIRSEHTRTPLPADKRRDPLLL